jgi:predicted DNA-binding transcriptional regulator YafY
LFAGTVTINALAQLQWQKPFPCHALSVPAALLAENGDDLWGSCFGRVGYRWVQHHTLAGQPLDEQHGAGGQEMTSRRIARCLRLLYLLQSGRARNTAELAQEMGVSRRTIFRDLRTFEEDGIPVEYDPSKGVHALRHDFQLPVLDLSRDDLLALLVAAHTSSSILGQQFGGVVDRAISKFLARLPSQVREGIALVLNSCIVERSLLSMNSEREAMGLRILKAIRERRKMRITYDVRDNSSHLLEATLLSPYHVTNASGVWCVIGPSSLHRHIRSFRMDCIRQVTVVNETYELPSHYLSRLRVNDQGTEAGERVVPP